MSSTIYVVMDRESDCQRVYKGEEEFRKAVIEHIGRTHFNVDGDRTCKECELFCEKCDDYCIDCNCQNYCDVCDSYEEPTDCKHPIRFTGYGLILDLEYETGKIIVPDDTPTHELIRWAVNLPEYEEWRPWSVVVIAGYRVIEIN